MVIYINYIDKLDILGTILYNMEKILEIVSESNPEMSYMIFKEDSKIKCQCPSFFYSSQKIEDFQCKHIRKNLLQIKDLMKK